MKSIDLYSLLPEFSKLLAWIQGKYSFDTEVLSAGFVGIILLIFLGFLLYSFFWGFIPAKIRIKKIKELVSELAPDNLTSSRRDTLEKARKLRPDDLGKLWQEFDETLILSSDGIHLNNTIDAGHFFNGQTLAPRIINTRLLAAVPGFLTAIGVIGTFAGLQIGLDSVSFSGDVEQQRNDIQLVIASAAVAFLTSVWGILTSVVFNMLEKGLEQNVKHNISDLQHTIDFLFPRIRPEQSLVNIATSSKSSEDSLNGLAERIGEQLQQAVSGMGEQVTAGIQEVMQPAMDSLVGASHGLADRMSTGATDALSQLINRFLSEISGAGEKQRQIMLEVTSDMKESMNHWQGQMNNFLNDLEAQSSTSNEREKQLNEHLFGKLEEFSTLMTSSADANTETAKETLEQNRKLIAEVAELAEHLTGITGDLGNYSQRIAEASTNMDQAGSQIRAATLVLDNGLKKAVTAVSELSAENTMVVQNTNHILEQIQSLKNELQSTADSIAGASQTASNTFDAMGERQQTFIKSLETSLGEYESSMKSQFETLSESASGFLADYTERVQSQTNTRLDEWNKQTENFTHQMVTTVQSLQSILDDIEDTIGKRRSPDA